MEPQDEELRPCYWGLYYH